MEAKNDDNLGAANEPQETNEEVTWIWIALLFRGAQRENISEIQ